MLAFLSRDPLLMDAIKNKRSIYCEFAGKIFGKTVTKRNKKEYAIGKQAILGLGYCMGANKFRNSLLNNPRIKIDLPLEEAQTIVDLYRKTFVMVPAFWKKCDSVIEALASHSPGTFPGVPFLKLAKERIILPSGLSIKYPNLESKMVKWYGRFKKEWAYSKFKTEKGRMDSVKLYGGLMTENICQALAGEICKIGIRRSLEKGLMPAGQVHDELLYVCKEEEAKETKKKVISAMADPIPWWPELPLEVEVGTGKNWLEAK